MKKNLLIFLWALPPWRCSHTTTAPARLVWPVKKPRPVQAALDFREKEQWQQAIDAYNEALAALPEEETAKRMQLQLARANARIYVGELPEAMFAMEHLLDEAAKGDDKKLENKVRALASAQYYTGWLMRLELAEKEEWMEPVEKARQNFRLLAEQSAKTDAKASEEHQKNLEAVVRLARMDLSELQALPLPKKCQGCKTSAPSAGAKKEQQAEAGQRRRTPAERASASAPTEPAPDRPLMISI